MASRYDPEFDRLVMAAPIIDMIGDGHMDGDDQPERPDGECGFCGGVGTVDDGDRLCPICIRAGAA